MHYKIVQKEEKWQKNREQHLGIRAKKFIFLRNKFKSISYYCKTKKQHVVSRGNEVNNIKKIVSYFQFFICIFSIVIFFFNSGF